MSEEEKVDYLEVDDLIPGQNYVCLSFISPENLIESKESFKVAKFLQAICKEKDMDVSKTMEQYKDYTYKFQEEIQKDFDELHNFKTNIRGLKVRGTYNTRDEAERRASKLQKTDSDFHVFVGQVGYWLPWDPCADKIEDENFLDSQLNDMMGKYKENTINKDIFYEEQKREKIKAATSDRLKKEREKKKTEEELKNQEKIDEEPTGVTKVLDSVIEGVSDSNGVIETEIEEEKVEEEKVEEDKVEEESNNIMEDKVLDEDLKKSLEEVDPWLANKTREQ